MKLDVGKLQNVRRLDGGKTTAQCPACAADGSDAKKEHLMIYPDGRFGCVVYPQDKTHNKAILKLAGLGERNGSSGCRLSVTPMRVEESTVLMKVGRLGRVKPTPSRTDHHPMPLQDEMSGLPEVAEVHPERPCVKPPPDLAASIEISSSRIKLEKLRELLNEPALAA